MSSYQTPEIVLRSAEGYLDLEQKASAFNLLLDYMTGKKNRQWSQFLEKIMILLIELALEFGKKELLKEPINNYKFASQYNNISSVENVLSHFIKIAEEKWERVAKIASSDIKTMEDLDSEEPEELFILALDIDSRTEKAIVREAMKGIWETYKMILEATSKNKKLEDLYGHIAHKCYEFCKKYNRRAEFKKLCETIRYQLNSIIRSLINNPDYHKIPFAIDLTNLETNEKQILIRFDQLEYIYGFELWQESIKTLEDIHHIMQKRRAAVKPKILSDYFENLAKIFWKSEFYHYSTVAFFNHYSLLISKNKNISSEELSQKSCTFILSVLCIPPLLHENLQSEDVKSRAAALLSSGSTIPSKQELIIYINKHNILDLCTPEVREIFYLIEENKNIVGLSKNSEPLLKVIQEKYTIFHQQLQNVIIYKLLMLLSKLYTKIKIDNFTKFLGTLDSTNCERIIHFASTSDYIKVRIDHRRRLLIFQDDVQDMQSLSLKFVNFSEDLKEVIYNIDGKKEEQKDQKIAADLRNEAQRFSESAKGALERRLKLIQDMKKIEREVFAKARPVEERITRAAEPTAARPVAQPTAEDKRKKKIEDSLAIYLQTRKTNLIKKLRGIKGFKIGKRKIEDYNDEDLENMTLDALEEAQTAWEKKEKERDENAIKNAFKRVDHLERAKREEYINTLKKGWEENQGEKEEIFKAHKDNFDKSLDIKNKMKQAATFRGQYTTRVLNERTEVYEEELQEFREKIIEDFKGKILELAKESLKAQLDAEEAERKKREEENAKIKERLEQDRETQAAQQTERLTRNTLRAEDMQKTQTDEPKFGFQRGTDKPREESKTGGFQRSEKATGPSIGFSRNTDLKSKEETKESESSGPRKFFSSSKKPETTTSDARVAETTATTTTTIEEGGWRTTKKPETTKTDKPTTTTTTGGFGRNTGTTSGGPPKFNRGPNPTNTPTTTTTEKKPEASGGWRKA